MSRRCGLCEETFKKNEFSFECCACKKKFHGKCTDLSDDEAKLLHSKTILKWYCRLCDPDIADILANFQKFKKVSNEIAKMNADNEKRLKEIEKRIDACEATKNTSNVEKIVQEEVCRKNQEDKEEEKLIESKKANIVYFNVPESNDEDISERMKFDFGTLNKVHDNDVIKHSQISNIYRVGKKQDNIDRPLIVRFKSVVNKENVLKKTGDLKLRWNNEVRRVYASIDNTDKQIKEHSKLVKELKERKEAGELNLGIRNDKIVTTFRRENAAQRVIFSDLFTS